MGFNPPESIDVAVIRRESLILEIKRLDTDLVNKDRRAANGRRMMAIEWHKWRQGAVEEKFQMEKEIVELKRWIAAERAKLGIGKMGGNPRDALYFSIRSAEKILCILKAEGDDALDLDERELLKAIQNYLESHAVLEITP